MNDALIVTTDARGVRTLTLNRPQRHNAFDDALIEALITQLALAAADETVRVLVLTGAGASFCSGADLDWMKSMVKYDEVANRQDALRLAKLMQQLYALDKPTLARVNGSAYGGGLGLLACCDIAIGVGSAKFALPEVKLGLIPAVISPYLLAAMGMRQCRRLFISGAVVKAQQAAEIGLLTHCVDDDALDEVVQAEVNALLEGGAQAHAATKQLLRNLAPLDEAWLAYSAETIAKLEVSPEAQSRMQTFLSKRSK